MHERTHRPGPSALRASVNRAAVSTHQEAPSDLAEPGGSSTASTQAGFDFHRISILPPGSVQRAPAQPKEYLPEKSAQKDYSFRFGGDKAFEQIATGKSTLGKGDKGIAVTKLQQALVDMGYLLPVYGVDAKFGDETETALKKFQHDVPVPETGKLDAATLSALDAKYDTRQPYLDNATFDPASPDKGLRTLSASDKASAKDALVPQRGVGGTSAVFQEEIDVKGKKEKYGDRMKARLQTIITELHKELYEDKEPLRADPAKNFHDWSVLEQTAEASKNVTDGVYGSYAKGPKMTAASGNFVDQWEDELVRNKALSAKELKAKATEKVWYLIASNCARLNNEHSAVPTDAKERAILTPIVESFVDTSAKVQTLLDLDIGWEGAQLEGTVYLQRYKQKTDDANRTQLWELFHTCIHEYIHSLAHSKFLAYAQTFSSTGDTVRYNTLVEGYCDFFTENVRATVKVTDALRKQVEGPYYDKAQPAPSVSPGVYPSRAQAEQQVAIVGIRNAEAAYFKGDVKRIGAP